MNEKEKVSVFFSCDGNYFPYLKVALKSIEKYASERCYDIYVLASSLSKEEKGELCSLSTPNITVRAKSVSQRIKHLQPRLKSRLRDYYSECIYYRIFIPSLFPDMKKCVYIDCDTVLCEDIANLYDTDLGSFPLAAVADESVPPIPAFCDYVMGWVGVDADKYFNSGVLVMNLEKMREEKIEEKFLFLLGKYNFETVAPDQDYLNFLCKDKVLYLPARWNKQPNKVLLADGDSPALIHFNMFDKPWHYRGVSFEHLFWESANLTDCKELLRRNLEAYTEEDRKRDRLAAERLVAYAATLSASEGGFASVDCDTLKI